jgi:anti-sigma factor RsiW
MSASLDNELDPEKAASMSAHLLTCVACSKEYAELMRAHESIKKHVVRHAAPDHLRHRIQTEIDALKPRKKVKKPFSWAWINAGVAMACSLVLGVSIYLYQIQPSDGDRLNQEIVASHYRSLLANHLSDVASSDNHTVKPWFAGKLDYSPPVVDFADQGYALVGGRLDYISQRTVAALVYRHNKHLINLFVWPDKSRAQAPAKSATLQGFHLLQWTVNGMDYSAISDTNAQELANFHQLLVAQIDKETPKP